MKIPEKFTVTESSGNVYADVGFPDAEVMLAKAELVQRIADIIEERGWSQTEAARHIGLDQPKVSELLRGKFRGYSMDRLMRMLTQLNQDINICTLPAPSAATTGHIAVRSGEDVAAASSSAPTKTAVW